MAPSVDPIFLVCITPFSGHFQPMFEILKGFINRGATIAVLTGSIWREKMESIGAVCYSLTDDADLNDAEFHTRFPMIFESPPGPARLTATIRHTLLEPIPTQFQNLQSALKDLKSKFPSRPVALITETGFGGALPLLLGAPGLRPVANTRVSILPAVLSSIDTAPFGLGMFPDSSPEGRARNKLLYQKMQDSPLAELQVVLQRVLAKVGARPSPYDCFNAGWYLADLNFQACAPSLEYPRSDAPATLKFLGGIPRGLPDPWDDKPEWWNEIVTNPQKKKIVAVCQGTIAIELDDLVAPTLEGLKDREDVIVVAILAKKGRALPPHIPVPGNARVWDYIPFDEMLRYTDVFVTNGGYGALQHSAARGVPLLMAGVTEEKFEICARGEWAGIAVNLKTSTPTPKQVAEGLDTLLTDSKYKKRALEIKAEMDSYDPLEILMQGVSELVSEKLKEQQVDLEDRSSTKKEETVMVG